MQKKYHELHTIIECWGSEKENQRMFTCAGVQCDFLAWLKLRRLYFSVT